MEESPVETPYLEALAERGTVFDTAIATAPMTTPAFPGLLAGAYPMDHGYNQFKPAHEPVQDRLTDAGVTTVGITGNVATSAVFDYDRGFDRFYDTIPIEHRDRLKELADQHADPPLGMGPSEWKRKRALQLRDNSDRTVPYGRADELTDEAVSSLESLSQGEDAFMWIHYMDPHYPYAPPREFLETDTVWDRTEVNRAVYRWLSDQPDRCGPRPEGGRPYPDPPEAIDAFRRYYRAEIRFVEDQIRRLISALERIRRMEETVLIITADHGEEFMEHDDYGHRAKLYDELIRVPLLVVDDSNYGLPAGTTVSEPTSHVDIPATVTDFFRIDPHPEWRGRSLREVANSDEETGSREYVLSEICHHNSFTASLDPEDAIVAVRGAGWKYIKNRQYGRKEAYDLDDDPREQSNLAEDVPVRVEMLASLCDRRLAAVEEASPRPGGTLPDVAKERLRQLGYRTD
ncbi:arylsulfatase A family protein [Halovivax ruber XH-70]|uniref:Arylsulfatase A family protein n=2 Tax=Halovivax ruber TaxID=387341 RepID=L0IA11_HALRX|nr:arylsulfatase A family protein [Halovivax ruber XH-70]